MPRRSIKDGKNATQRYREKHPEKYLETNKIYRQNNPDYNRNWFYKVKYNLSLEEYETLLKQQNNCCKICKRPESRTYKNKIVRLAVDHNHSTGIVRGLLCKACNTAIGLLEENPTFFLSAIEYLNAYS